jgi:superfamily II helicase
MDMLERVNSCLKNTIMKCLFGHKFKLMGQQIVCEKCGMLREEIQPKRRYVEMGQLPKIPIIEIIKKEDSLDKLLEDPTK